MSQTKRPFCYSRKCCIRDSVRMWPGRFLSSSKEGNVGSHLTINSRTRKEIRYLT